MGCKILLTDDDELVVMSVESMLESEGYDVTTACNGREALDKASKNTYELFVLDIIMPGMSGFEVCEALRKLEKYAETPIVMLTAKSTEQDRKKGFEMGATRFLSKPINPTELLKVLEEVVVSK